ncbi:MAG: hypothetical protein JO129_03420 [Candidatus Dependentiae bacterium]|nr:hypothetical protein [Candidatus Dependentiae bacterium]
MKKLLIILLLLFPCLAQTQDVLKLRCKQPLQYFIAAEQQNTLLSYDTMAQIFTCTSMNYKQLRKAQRADMASCRRFIKKHEDDSFVNHDLLQHLRLLYKYTKQHKECCKAIQFHEELQQRYRLAFNNPNIAHDVEAMPYLFGVQRAKYKSRAYFNIISADLRKIEKFEDTIHGDHGVLKAHNYVYKIELIKIRNNIYHNNRYKFQTRYF